MVATSAARADDVPSHSFSQNDAPARRSIKKLLLPFFQQIGSSTQNLTADSAGFWRTGEDRYWLPRIVFRGAAESGEAYIRIGIFAGIHGDEPAGVEALVDLLRYMETHPALFRAYRITIYPLCNPTGYEDGTRHSRSGKDLNREFWRGSMEPEIALLERELMVQKFDGLIALHSDDTSDGLYGFVKGHALTRHVLEPALARASTVLPRNYEKTIDNFQANEGIIEAGYPGVLSAPPAQHPRPFEIVFETPQLAPLAQQVDAHTLALEEILLRFRAIISEAQSI